MTKTSGIRGFMNNVVAAREKQAKRYVNGVLLTMDDTTLKAAGFNRADLRKEGTATLPF